MDTQRDQYNKCADVFSGVLGGEKAHLAKHVAEIVQDHMPTTGRGDKRVRMLDFGANDGMTTLLYMEAIREKTGTALDPALYDIAEQAIAKARANIQKLTGDNHSFIVTTDYNDIPSDRQLVTATHVVPAMASREQLRNVYFSGIFNKMQQGGVFVTVVSHPHPENITQLHASFQCRFPLGKVEDGAPIKTDLYPVDAAKPFLTVDDYYWSAETLREAAQAAGFQVRGEHDIPDFEIDPVFMRNHSPAYYAMVLEKS